MNNESTGGSYFRHGVATGISGAGNILVSLRTVHINIAAVQSIRHFT